MLPKIGPWINGERRLVEAFGIWHPAGALIAEVRQLADGWYASVEPTWARNNGAVGLGGFKTEDAAQSFADEELYRAGWDPQTDRRSRLDRPRLREYHAGVGLGLRPEFHLPYYSPEVVSWLRWSSKPWGCADVEDKEDFPWDEETDWEN